MDELTQILLDNASQESDTPLKCNLDYALNYARLGWSVFPIHFIVNGGCSCKKPCQSPGKHPSTPNGFKDATTDIEKIKLWWRNKPKANIGIRTGRCSGLFVVDIDPRNGGDVSLQKLIAEHGAFAPAIVAVTGSGGRHYVFKYPGEIGKSTTNLFPGIDTRGDGGYIVAAPSNHLSGSYMWESGSVPWDSATLSPLPHWLVSALSKGPKPPPKAHSSGLSSQQITELVSALACINADDYNDWLKVGMALHSTGDAQAYKIWLDWSSRSDKFDSDELLKKWQSFTPDQGRTIKTIFGMANDAGWSSSPSIPLPSPPNEGDASDSQHDQQIPLAIKKALDKIEDDKGLLFEPVVIAALSELFVFNKPLWQRIKHKFLKPHRIAAEIEKEIILFRKKYNKSKNPTFQHDSALPSVSDNSIQHFSSTNPALGEKNSTKILKGFLIEPDDTNGDDGLLIESKAALVIASHLKGKLAYCIESQSWYVFLGSYWKILETPQLADGEILQLIYLGTDPIGFKACYKNNIKNLIADGNRLPLPHNDSRIIPFQNGLLNLDTQKLEAISSSNAQSWVLPYNYIKKSDCVEIKKWLANAVDNDQATVRFLRAWMAAVLHGLADLQKFLHLKGSGGTGKSTFLRLMMALIGEDNSVETSLDQLEGNRFETARLYGKRLAVVNDSDKYGGSVNILKKITGQDPIRLERKHQQQNRDFIFQGLVMIASNESLSTTDFTSGLDRRRITVIFDRRITDDEKRHWDSLGGEKAVLHNELSGLINWLLELSIDEVKDIIRNPPERIHDANNEAMKANNPIADWFSDCCLVDKFGRVQVGSKIENKHLSYETGFLHADEWLYPNYLRWCQRNNRNPVAVRRFREILLDTLKTMNIDAKSPRAGKGRFIEGITLKKDDVIQMGTSNNAIMYYDCAEANIS